MSWATGGRRGGLQGSSRAGGVTGEAHTRGTTGPTQQREGGVHRQGLLLPPSSEDRAQLFLGVGVPAHSWARFCGEWCPASRGLFPLGLGVRSARIPVPGE